MQEPNLEISSTPSPSIEMFAAQMHRGMVADDLERLRLAADLYHRVEGKFPRKLSDLLRSEALLNSGLNRPGIDTNPWGHKYELKSGDEGVLLTCEGSDGRAGGDGEAADTVVR